MRAASPHWRATVIVVTYNHRKVIGDCLDALQTTLSADDEVIVVDNASVDGTADFVDAEYGWARLVRSVVNSGFGGGCNQGARAARGTVLVFLNPDTLPRPGWLDALIEPIGADAVGLTTAKLLLQQRPELIDAFGNDLHLSGIPTCRGWGELASAHPQREDVAAVSGACFAMSGAVFWRLGGFDERLFLYYEDDDLSLRARLAGFRCVAVPDAIVLHDHRPGFSPDKLRYLERNRLWSLLKVLSLNSLVLLAPVLLGGSFLAWGMALHGGWSHVGALVRAYVDLVTWLPDLAAARRGVQGRRVVTDAKLLELHAARLPLAQVASGRAAEWGERVLASAFGGGRRLAFLLGVR